MQVTPHVGVWIETLLYVSVKKRGIVTPHVGVWIETYLLLSDEHDKQSHLM